MKIYQPLALNDRGGRTNQEDSISPVLGTATDATRTFLVCDGMGGHEAGEVASQAVCESMSGYFAIHSVQQMTPQVMKEALECAYAHLFEVDNTESAKKMGTTLTLLHLSDNEAAVAHIGDSRVYQLRPKSCGGVEIVYQTSDHSLVNELVRAGIITAEEAVNHPKKNVITRAMQPREGRLDGATLHITNDVRPDDVFFMCTDGITEVITDRILDDLFGNDAYTDAQRMQIIEMKCRESSHDNFSAYLVRIKEGVLAPAITCSDTEVSVDNPSEATPEMLSAEAAVATPVVAQSETKKKNRMILPTIMGGICAVLVASAAVYWYVNSGSQAKATDGDDDEIEMEVVPRSADRESAPETKPSADEPSHHDHMVPDEAQPRGDKPTSVKRQEKADNNIDKPTDTNSSQLKEGGGGNTLESGNGDKGMPSGNIQRSEKPKGNQPEKDEPTNFV